MQVGFGLLPEGPAGPGRRSTVRRPDCLPIGVIPVIHRDDAMTQHRFQSVAFQAWAADAASCKGNFLEGVQDRRFLDRLAKLGVVESPPWQEGDLPEGELVASQPVTVAGQPATHFKYWADSGAEFYAIVAASPETVAKALDLAPVPPKQRKDFDERTVAMRFARAPRKGERLAPALFVRRAESGSGSEVGCREFDG
jgi:hypothetical protein